MAWAFAEARTQAQRRAACGDGRGENRGLLDPSSIDLGLGYCAASRAWG